MGIDKLTPKLIWRNKRSRTANTILKNKVGGLNFKVYYKATVSETVILTKE